MAQDRMSFSFNH